MDKIGELLKLLIGYMCRALQELQIDRRITKAMKTYNKVIENYNRRSDNYNVCQRIYIYIYITIQRTPAYVHSPRNTFLGSSISITLIVDIKT